MIGGIIVDYVGPTYTQPTAAQQQANVDASNLGVRYLGMISLDGSVYQFTANALELGPSGTGASLADIATAIAGQSNVSVLSAVTGSTVESTGLGLDIGAADTLERYAQWRRTDNFAMVAGTDLLVWLFSNDSKPLRLARDLGLAAVNRVPALRRFFVRHAMGLVGDLPKLIRGERP